MKLEKSRYKQAEVEEIVNGLNKEYKKALSEKRGEILDLRAEVRRLSAELALLKEKDGLISETLKSAEEKAKEIEKNALKSYTLEIEALKNFSEKWRSYFKYLCEKYPHYTAVKQAKEVYDKISKVVAENKTDKEKVEKLKRIPEINKEAENKNKKFNPQKKINEYIAATSDNGFNLDEVLNPGDIKLEDICKELGLIDEE